MRSVLAMFFALVCFSSAVATAAPQQNTVPAARPQGLIILSYPASVIPRAMPAVRAGFDQSKWPSGCANGYFGLIEVGGCPTRETALEETLIKSAYYALDAYTALVQQFGRESVVLQPATLTVGRDAQLKYELTDPELPAAVRIDFAAVVSPRAEKSRPSWTSTHGNFFMPAYVIRDGAGRLIAASKGLEGLQDGTGQPSVLLRLRAIGLKLRVDEGKPYIIGTPQRAFDNKTWVAHTASTDGNPPLATGYIGQDLVKAAAVMSAAAPGTMDSYAALFRDEIAKNPAAAQELLPEFVKAEAEFVSSGSVMGLESLRTGDFGASVRERLLAERKQNREVARASFFSGLLMMSNAMSDYYTKGTQPGLNAMAGRMEIDRKLDEMNQGFSQSFAGLAERQAKLSLRVGGELTSVQATTLAQLREQFRQILQRAGAPAH